MDGWILLAVIIVAIIISRKEKDWILDPFMGSGSTGEWCIKNNRNFVGIEIDTEVFEIAKQRLSNL